MSLKFASPLLGYNNNVRHKGRVFHIQTEDSGAKYGHVITHLFVDGGRILKSVKSSYAEYLGSDRLAEIVRDLMKEQHKAMAVALRDGSFDRFVEGKPSPSPETIGLAVELAEAPSSPNPLRAAWSTVPAPAPVPAAPPVSAEANGSLKAPGRSGATPGPGLVTERSDFAHTAPEARDVALMDRAAATASDSSAAMRTSANSPPPPAHPVREKTGVQTHPVTPTPAEGPVTASSFPAIPHNPSPAPPAGPAASAVRAAATARPTSAFGQARPQGQSIFGEDLMSDKSLDEVILSYLAAELESSKK